MGNVFAGSEVVEMGIQIEKNGRDFYGVLLEKSKSEKAREIYKYLSAEEGKHIVAFEKVLELIRNYEPVESYPGEYFAYLKALAGGYVFTRKNKGSEIAEKIKSDNEAVDLGIKFEKESIVFYEGMKNVVPEKERGVIEALINQEKNHLLKLIEIKDSL
ncbi:MAG: ferritin family protein [Candidatus Aureabacteria bacterium]|nr:ferritin family protein [Candidatus Auribacterota bacterium]